MKRYEIINIFDKMKDRSSSFGMVTGKEESGIRGFVKESNVKESSHCIFFTDY
jgi:hypothetical protein